VEQKDETRKILGYLPLEFGVYPKMPAIDLLEHLAVMKGITDRKQRKESSRDCCNRPICGTAARKRSAGTREE
jgi:ABC-2 type transport system ATP-binding protein